MQSMKIALRTDFRDYYDHWFDYYVDRPCQGLGLDRRADIGQDGLSKRDQFRLLEQIGYPVPLHGTVQHVWNISSAAYLVVYEDEYQHRGEGKALWHGSKAAMQCPDRYCSVFIPSTNDPLVSSESRRLLAVGDRMFWLRYRSNGWMSNHANEVEVDVACETLRREKYANEGNHDFTLLEKWPLFAIDFVHSAAQNQILAIDFNSAPGMKGTGMEEVLPARRVVEELKAFLLERRLS